MMYKMTFMDEVDNVSIRNSITKWSNKLMEEMTKFQDQWLLENMTRFYGHSPSIDRLKIDNDGWTYKEIIKTDCVFTKILFKDSEWFSTITLTPVHLVDYLFKYIIENNDGYRTEGMI